jgi:hypothetical protein
MFVCNYPGRLDKRLSLVVKKKNLFFKMRQLYILQTKILIRVTVMNYRIICLHASLSVASSQDYRGDEQKDLNHKCEILSP